MARNKSSEPKAQTHPAHIRLPNELYQELVAEAGSFPIPLSMQKYVMLVIQTRDANKITKLFSKRSK